MSEAAAHEQMAAMPTLSVSEPKIEQKYKCHTCYTILKESELMDTTKNCPLCGETFKNLQKMCKLDHCNCSHTDPIHKIAYCPECNKPVCPECGSHDVVQISRVTGYLAEISGFNRGKQQEVRDRHRWNLDN
jgi:rRNA maturation endonuclease Nob1